MTEIELQRARWRRIRREPHLINAEADDFAIGDLGRRVADLHGRLFVAPGDPERGLPVQDAPFWQWWDARPTEQWGVSAPFGREFTPTAWGAVRYLDSGRNDGWDAYLCARRGGALDMAIGRPAVAPRGDRGVFRLLGVLGRIWIALATYKELVTAYDIRGPYELTLGVRDVAGSVLGNLAAGWAGAEEGFGHYPTAMEQSYVARWEIDELESDDGVQSTVYTIGDWISNCFGERQRTYLERTGDRSGSFGWPKVGH